MGLQCYRACVSDVILQTIHSEGTSFSDCAIDQAAEGGSRPCKTQLVMKEAMAIIAADPPLDWNVELDHGQQDEYAEKIALRIRSVQRYVSQAFGKTSKPLFHVYLSRGSRRTTSP